MIVALYRHLWRVCDTEIAKSGNFLYLKTTPRMTCDTSMP